MARQSSTSSERFLAVGIGALVWTLAGVNSPMSSKRTGIAEFLYNLLVHPGAVCMSQLTLLQ